MTNAELIVKQITEEGEDFNPRDYVLSDPSVIADEFFRTHGYYRMEGGYFKAFTGRGCVLYVMAFVEPWFEVQVVWTWMRNYQTKETVLKEKAKPETLVKLAEKACRTAEAVIALKGPMKDLNWVITNFAHFWEQSLQEAAEAFNAREYLMSGGFENIVTRLGYRCFDRSNPDSAWTKQIFKGHYFTVWPVTYRTDRSTVGIELQQEGDDGMFTFPWSDYFNQEYLEEALPLLENGAIAALEQGLPLASLKRALTELNKPYR